MRLIARGARARGWTRRELAERVGIGQVYVAQIGAAREVSLTMLGRLAAAFRVRPVRLLD